MKFVVDILKNAPRYPKLADYAVAQVFGENRAAGTYEMRAEGIANDLADNQPPDAEGPETRLYRLYPRDF